MSEDAAVGAILDGRGGARRVGWAEVRTWTPEQGLLWLHLDYCSAEVRKWIEEESGLEPVTVDALLAEETRPRCVAAATTLLLNLRGMNVNPGQEADDMISLRVWAERSRVLSLRHRRVMAAADVLETLDRGVGPADTAHLLQDLIDRLAFRIGEAIGALDDRVDDLEDQILSAESYSLRTLIGSARREAIRLRRFLAPQRDALARLYMERLDWLDDRDRAHLREAADRVTRYVEDLDAARDRAAVAQEELNSRLAEQMNKTMYLLSIVAAVFLPLGLLTGLLGINVGGIPGTESPWAFTIVCILLVAIAIVQTMVFRRRHLI